MCVWLDMIIVFSCKVVSISVQIATVSQWMIGLNGNSDSRFVSVDQVVNSRVPAAHNI